MIYQAITHAQERFNHIPKALLDNLEDSHKLGLLSTGFNMSAGMFVGGTAKNPGTTSSKGFQPIKMMKDYWNTVTKGDGQLSLNDIKDAINKSFGGFISGGVGEKHSGLYLRRVFDFILTLGGNPGVNSPYGQEKKLSETLKGMLLSEQDPAKKSSIQSVINDLRKLPSWKKFLG